jgi:hypothetical protein
LGFVVATRQLVIGTRPSTRVIDTFLAKQSWR